MHKDLQGKSVILFDGVCNLCQRVVQEVIKRDKADRFRFASLQSKFGQQMVAQHDIQADSLVLWKDGRVWIKSDAALEIAKGLSGGYALMGALQVLPKRLRDLMYDYIAKHRYGWFGKSAECWMPSEKLNKKFIEI